jgi:hypothetical protein
LTTTIATTQAWYAKSWDGNTLVTSSLVRQYDETQATVWDLDTVFPGTTIPTRKQTDNFTSSGTYTWTGPTGSTQWTERTMSADQEMWGKSEDGQAIWGSNTTLSTKYISDLTPFDLRDGANHFMLKKQKNEYSFQYDYYPDDEINWREGGYHNSFEVTFPSLGLSQSSARQLDEWNEGPVMEYLQGLAHTPEPAGYAPSQESSYAHNHNEPCFFAHRRGSVAFSGSEIYRENTYLAEKFSIAGYSEGSLPVDSYGPMGVL